MISLDTLYCSNGRPEFVVVLFSLPTLRLTVTTVKGYIGGTLDRLKLLSNYSSWAMVSLHLFLLFNFLGTM